MSRAILVLNAGSSSIKFAVYEHGHILTPMLTGRVGGIKRAPDFTATDSAGQPMPAAGMDQLPADATHADLTLKILDWVRANTPGVPLAAAGHRVVHGGESFSGPAPVTPEVYDALDALTPLAPLHQPNNLSAIKAIAAQYPDLPQVACFDTSFHRTMPRVAQLFGIPRALTDSGVVRYGFHGLSYEYIASVLPEYFGAHADGRIIVAHLGNGASMAALHHRQSVMTTMGFTALHGLLMGRRSGTVDAGMVLHLLQERGMSVDEVWTMLYQQSGLQGVSGISNSMQVLTASDEPAAREAVDLFCHRAVCEIGALAAGMGGLNGIVFTAGIGENSRIVRERIVSQLDWLGATLDPAANERVGQDPDKPGGIITTPESQTTVAVIPTDEQLVIARATAALT